MLFKSLALSSLLTLSSCAAITETRGMLAQFTGQKALELNQLERDCDLRDSAACYFFGRKTPVLARLPIVQGATSGNHAVFTAIVPAAQKVSWFLFTKADRKLQALAIAKVYTKPHSPWQVHRIQVKNLEAGRAYELIAAEENGRLIDARTFYAPPKSAAGALRVAFLYGLSDQPNGGQSIWDSLASKKPEALFLIGDNVFATTINGAERAEGAPFVGKELLWDRYIETFSALPLFKQPELVPVYTTWNDRDFGVRQGNYDSKCADPSRDLQETFFPVVADTDAMREGPGTAKSIVLGGQTFILLDNRAFRGTDRKPPACAKAKEECAHRDFTDARDEDHFGHLQLDWAMETVDKAVGPVWFISGDSWFDGGKNPSVFESNHPMEFQSFREDLQKAVNKDAKDGRAFPIMFVGGSANPESREVQLFKNYKTFEYGVGFGSFPGQAGAYRFFTSVIDNGQTKLSSTAVQAGKEIETRVNWKDAAKAERKKKAASNKRKK